LSSPTGDRISTVIYANGMSAVSNFMSGHYITTTFLGFDNLALPDGLEYVDDLSTATGNWR
jgi:hypothetical protein